MTNSESRNKKFRALIWILSILIPVVVAILFNVKIPGVERMGFLPPIYATINGITAFILVIAVFQIKKGNRKVHERLMKIAILCSILFLLMYIVYHMTSESTPYGGEGLLRYVYFIILISHILLSIAIIPLVLITYYRAFTQQFQKHRRIARIAFPLWLYVAISGVVIYLMISPYY
jgi:putative membrane protein